MTIFFQLFCPHSLSFIFCANDYLTLSHTLTLLSLSLSLSPLTIYLLVFLCFSVSDLLYLNVVQYLNSFFFVPFGLTHSLSLCVYLRV